MCVWVFVGECMYRYVRVCVGGCLWVSACIGTYVYVCVGVCG